MIDSGFAVDESVIREFGGLLSVRLCFCGALIVMAFSLLKALKSFHSCSNWK